MKEKIKLVIVFILGIMISVVISVYAARQSWGTSLTFTMKPGNQALVLVSDWAAYMLWNNINDLCVIQIYKPSSSIPTFTATRNSSNTSSIPVTSSVNAGITIFYTNY